MYRNRFMRTVGACAVSLLVHTASHAIDNHPITLLPEFRPIGGGGNNLLHPEFDPIPGAAERTLAPLNFAPGTNNGLVDGPNPRLISNAIAGGTGANGDTSSTADTRASAWIYVFGQFVDHDLDLEQAPPTNAAIDITIPPNDPLFAAGTVIAMTRDDRSATTDTIINTTAGYLDLSQLYGSSVDVANSLRNPDGTLKSSDGGQALPVVDGAFVTGDPRVMENPELTAVTTLFMREHNFWVGQIKNQNPDWTGDQLYNMAKAITTGEYQNIIYREYLPVLVGRVLGPYQGYDANVDARVSEEFSTAAFRVGHSQVSEEQTGIDNLGVETFSESLAQAFFNTPEEDLANGFNPLLRNLAVEFSQATDVYTVPVLRNLLFAGLVGGGVDQVDLIAIDIQRERDVGLGTLNQVRAAINMAPYTSFAELTSDVVVQKSFESVYGTIDAVDLFMGGLAEDHADGALVGPTFQTIISAQFDALRKGDRFFWMNQGFDAATSRTIAHTRLADIVNRNSDTTSQQANLFLVNSPARHSRHHWHGGVDNHGRRGVPFTMP